MDNYNHFKRKDDAVVGDEAKVSSSDTYSQTFF
jgi:hypothetical protein